jgi:hypothetical protein
MLAGLTSRCTRPMQMGRVQRGRDLGDDARSTRAALQRAELAVEQRAHVAPADIAHRDEQDSAGFAGLEYRDDVRVVNGRRSPRLTDEPLAERDRRGQSRVPGSSVRPMAVEPDVDGRGRRPPCRPSRSAPPAGSRLSASRTRCRRSREDLFGHRASSVRLPVRCPLSLLTQAPSWHQAHSAYWEIAG